MGETEPIPPTDVVGPGPAFATWLFGMLVGMLLVSSVVLATIGADVDNLSIGEIVVATVPAWIIFLAGMVFTSRRAERGPVLAGFRRHYGVAVRPIDLLGIPLGVITQVALVPAVYLPLRALWPNTFETEELERRAQELADRAGGWTTVLLVVFVAIGAPVVEELVYRGMLQRAFSRRIGAIPALLSISVMFALVHPSPVEYPGLLVAGLVFGSSTARLDRIGMSWITHAAFNATGLWFVLR